MALTKAEKKEIVTVQLKELRKELREMHSIVNDQQVLPAASEVKNVMSKMEGLLEVLEPNTGKKSKSKSKSSK